IDGECTWCSCNDQQMTAICFEVVIHGLVYVVRSSLLFILVLLRCSQPIRFPEENLPKSDFLSSWKASSCQHVKLENALKHEIKITMAV
ncbi:hypothetical protein A2U01_0045629, partial [Trifolium medium]|nr:hypothetical protein [Trifolium medium]